MHARRDYFVVALLISGMYDLHAPLLSTRSKYVKITPEEEAAASAMRQLGRIRCPVAVAWSIGDSPEFRRQSKVFAAALQRMGRLASRTEVFSANHFEEPRSSRNLTASSAVPCFH
jgi:arylformamidase